MTETFISIANYETLYKVSNLGRVLSRRNGRIMRPVVHRDGYRTIKLSKAGRATRFYVHRLVCAAFNGPSPFPGAQVAHIDGDPANISAGNLRWCSQSENEADKSRHGRTPRGSRHSQARLTEATVANIRRRVVNGETQAAMCREYRISSGHMSDIVNGRKWAEGEHATGAAGDARRP